MPKSPLSPALFDFLRELSANNDRDWFTDNKARYQSDVLDPAVELVRQLEKPLARVAPMLAAVPKRSGGSILRIYRDTRFGKDKTPYKTNVGISLKHQAGDDIHAPGAYLHLDPQETFIGAGCWRPERQSLASIRAAIDSDSKSWLKAKRDKKFAGRFKLTGESLKTSPRDFPSDHPMIEDLRRIDFIAIAHWTEADWVRNDVVDRIISDIKAARPLMNFLCNALAVPY
jgi:uncharacterized protein (TIGR02453 family)